MKKYESSKGKSDNTDFEAPQPATLKKGTAKGFLNIPTGALINSYSAVLAAKDKIDELPARKGKFNNSQKIEVLGNGKVRQITFTSEKVKITITIPDFHRLKTPAKKIFKIALNKINEQAVHNGKLARKYVSFPLADLIRKGLYTTPQSARVGFRSAMATLMALQVQCIVKESKKKTITIDEASSLFVRRSIKNGQCLIYLNEYINWGAVIQYFTYAPKYFFDLSDKAGSLLDYVVSLARQNVRKIEEKGYFTISLRAIQSYALMLPSEKGNDHPGRDIIEPIKKAVEEIQSQQEAYYHNKDLQLSAVYDPNASIEDQLDRGYLKVAISGDFAEPFKALSKSKAQKTKETKAKNDKIMELAIAKALAKKGDA